MTEIVPTQGDREAAADLALERGLINGSSRSDILAGKWDHWPPVQAFARHRLAAIEEAAKVAEAKYEFHDFGTVRSANYRHAGVQIAKAIRNLKDPTP